MSKKSIISALATFLISSCVGIEGAQNTKAARLPPVTKCPSSIDWDQAQIWGTGGHIEIDNISWSAYSGTDAQGVETMGAAGFNAQRVSRARGAHTPSPTLDSGISETREGWVQLLCKYSYQTVLFTMLGRTEEFGLTISGYVETLQAEPAVIDAIIAKYLELKAQPSGYAALRAALMANPELVEHANSVADLYAMAQASDFCNSDANAAFTVSLNALRAAFTSLREPAASSELLNLFNDYILKKPKFSDCGGD